MQLRHFGMAALPAVLLLSTTVFAQTAQDGNFQLHPFTNVIVNDGFINVTNTGASIDMNFAVNSGAGGFSTGGSVQFGTTANTTASNYRLVGYGDICVNAYVFSPDEQLQACCSCHLSPNALGSWDVAADLLSNTLTGAPVKDVVVKLVATAWNGSLTSTTPSGTTTFTSVTSSTCNAATAGAPVSLFDLGFPTGTSINLVPNSVIVPGMLAWGRNQGSESPFLNGTLSMGTGSPYPGEPLPQTELAHLQYLCAYATNFGSGKGLCKSCRFGGL